MRYAQDCFDGADYRYLLDSLTEGELLMADHSTTYAQGKLAPRVLSLQQ